jgi:hypothetical protein
MPSSTQYLFASLIALSGILTGCCSVPGPVGCGSCGISNNCGSACPGLLHGELAGRIRDAITGGCCSGCGEVYYDEQINEPPTCDPCRGCGEFAGDSCGTCRPFFERLRDLWCAPCGTSCGCDSCGTDTYASENSGSGYCPNCRDGVAGNPGQHAHHHAQQVPTQATPKSHSIGKNEEGIPVPQSAPSSKLEPVPDPNSDAPTKSTPVHSGGATSQRKSTRAIHVPASAQSRPSQSRLVK